LTFRCGETKIEHKYLTTKAGLAMTDTMTAAASVACEPLFIAKMEEVADQIIADNGGNARAAVVELATMVHCLADDNRLLMSATSHGFARRAWPFGKPAAAES
jgi:hypothetical protein